MTRCLSGKSQKSAVLPRRTKFDLDPTENQLSHLFGVFPSSIWAVTFPINGFAGRGGEGGEEGAVWQIMREAAPTTTTSTAGMIFHKTFVT